MKELTASKVKNTWMVSNGQTLREFAISKGVQKHTILYHLRKGCSLEQAIEQISRRGKYRESVFQYNGKEWTILELVNSPLNVYRIDAYILQKRIIGSKWDVARALATPVRTCCKKGSEYIYEGKHYRSKRHICNVFGLNYVTFDHYLKIGIGIGDAIKLSSTKEVTLLPYRGSNYTIKQLVLHPDNIYGLHSTTITYRVIKKGMSVEEAFNTPKRIRARRKVVYKGITYLSIYQLTRKLGLYCHYPKLTTINDDEVLIQQIDKLLNAKQ